MNQAEYLHLQNTENSTNRVTDYGILACNRMVKMTQYLSGLICEDDLCVDFGGNDGLVAEKFQEMTHVNMTVCDVSAEKLEVARARGLTVLEAQLEKLPVADNTFAWGFCSHTIEHVYDFDTTLAELFRVTKYGIFFVIPLEDDEARKKSVAHMRHNPDPEWWAAELELVGFKVKWWKDVFTSQTPTGDEVLGHMPDVLMMAFKPEGYELWKGIQDMDEARKFDVVIAWYRQKAFWPTVLDGLLTNSANINKVIVVNDEETIPELASEGLDLVILNHPHTGHGPSESFNQGVAAATTEHVLLMEGDIILPRSALAEDDKLITGKRIVCRGVTRIDPDSGKVVQPDWRVAAAEKLTRTGRHWPLMACNYTVVHREEFNRLGGFNIDLCAMHGSNSYADEDREFAVRWLAANGPGSLKISTKAPVIHLGGRREKAVPYVPMEAREVFVDALAKLFGQRYHLFCEDVQEPEFINIAHLDRSAAMDVRLDCKNLYWLRSDCQEIKVKPPLVYFNKHELFNYAALLTTKLEARGRLYFELEDHPCITPEFIQPAFKGLNSYFNPATRVFQVVKH